MEYKEQIKILNTIVRMRIAPSAVQGVGIIAMRDIPSGTRLNANLFPKAYDVPYHMFNFLKPEVKNILLERFPTIVNGSAFMYPDTALQGYMNHSNEPNYDCLTDTTIKDIKKGEEIFEDYRVIPGHEKVFTWLVDKKKK